MPGAGLVYAKDFTAQRSNLVFSSKPRTSQVRRAFVPASGSDLDALQQAVAERARQAGWALSTVSTGSVSGTKTMTFGQATLGIGQNPYVTPHTVTITLTPVDPNL